MTTLAFVSGIGGGELFVIFVIFLLLFGSKKLPGIARNLGRTMAELQRAAREVREEFLRADMELRQSEPPSSSLPPAPSEEPSYGEWHPDLPPADHEPVEPSTSTPPPAETTESASEPEAPPASEVPTSPEAEPAPSDNVTEPQPHDGAPDAPPTERHDQAG